MANRELVSEIKRALVDPTRVLEGLGLLGQGRQRQRQAAGWIIRCVVHEDRTPSCSVQVRDGLLLWRCHACGADGDVLTLVAAARNLSVRREFKQVLLEAARLGGLWQVVDELEGRAPPGPRKVVAAPARHEDASERVYPPEDTVDALWRASGPVASDGEASAYLTGRALDPDRVDAGDLARVLPAHGALPSWARCRGGSWREAGYRLIVPMWDPGGSLRSVRAWRIVDGDGPKRLPPSGHKAADLVMADAFGLAMLRGTREPARVLIVEGEPDFLTWATLSNDPGLATIGVISGSWTERLAQRFPVGCRVSIRTDSDQAGDRYAVEIEQGLRRRCFVVWTKRSA